MQALLHAGNFNRCRCFQAIGVELARKDRLGAGGEVKAPEVWSLDSHSKKCFMKRLLCILFTYQQRVSCLRRGPVTRIRPDHEHPHGRRWRQVSLLVCFALSLPCCGTAGAQQPQGAALRLGGLLPGGVRKSATASWGAFDFILENRTDSDRQARVLTFYKDLPDVQYGRDVWVPAQATLSTWMLVGPAPANLSGMTCDIQMEVDEFSGGKSQLLLPNTEERLRSRGIIYRRREPFSVLLLDNDASGEGVPGRLPQPDSAAEEALRLVRVFRQMRTLSEMVQRVGPAEVPPTAEAFDGIDHFIVASAGLARNPTGMIALRHWLEQGGKVWVMLDLVEPDALAPLLGDALDFQVVDRIALASFRVETVSTGREPVEPTLQEHDRPVDFVRVQLPPGEQVRNTIEGWPAWFTRPVGRGKVVFSTLGARGWHRPRTRRDPPSPYTDYRDLPIAEQYLIPVGEILQPSDPEKPFPVESLQPLLAEEIGYSVVSRTTAVLIFGAALGAWLVLGILLRKLSRPELLGWLGPVAAVGATIVFLVLGERSRRAVPPTVAVAQIVEPVSGKDEMAVHGLLAVYRPKPGPVEAGAEQGGLFQLDPQDMGDQVRQFILTDTDAWHWERLSLLAEPRQAPFHVTLPMEKPIAALARFGPEGIEGKLSGPLHNLSDAVLSTPMGPKLAVHIEPDGAFRAAGSDALPKGQYLSGTLLTDRQQRRQDVYGAFLKEPGPGSLRGRNVLLAWSDPLDMHFDIAPGARVAGSALIVAPLRLERLAAGERATIPGSFLPYQRILDNGERVRPTMQPSRDIEMHLRFQLPTEVLPFQVERARFSARIEAPGRRVAIAGQEDGRLTEIYRIDSPLDPIRLDITEERFLHVDEEGGVHLTLSIRLPSSADTPGDAVPRPDATPEDRSQRGAKSSGGRPRMDRPVPMPEPGGASPATRSEKWATIHYLELEVSGQAK